MIYSLEGRRGWLTPRPADRFPHIRVAATYRRFPACLLFLGGVGRCRLPLQEMTEGAERSQSIANNLDDRSIGTAKIAPGTPHIQYQKIRDRITATGLMVNRFASSSGVTVSPSSTWMPK